MLKITAQDFGPITQCEVELKPLTIFLGPSNSGKSYLATLIYGLINAVWQTTPMSWFYPERRLPARIPRQLPTPFDLPPDLDLTVLDQMMEWAEQNRHRQHVEFATLPGPIRDMASSHVETILGSLGETLDHELFNSHGPISDLIRRSAESKMMRISVTGNDPFLSADFSMQTKDDGLTVHDPKFDQSAATLRGGILDHIMRGARLGLVDHEGGPSRRSFLQDLVEFSSSSLYLSLIQQFPTNAFYLPAARSGVTQGHKVIASTVVRQSRFAGLQHLNIPTLSGVVTDFMSHMLTMETTPSASLLGHRRRPPELDDVIAFFERDVVSGAVEIDQNAGNSYPEIYYEPIGGIGRFTFNRTSSMVSELAPVILFLKHLVQQGDLVILEEPESHLHPAIQQQMARAIVRLKNAGFKVLITTHSDLFLGSINNLMKLHSSPPSVLDQLGLEEPDRLDPRDVAAYQFVPSDKAGSNDVIRLRISEDIGIEETEFSAVVERLYDDSIVLQRGMRS